jgi:hypothetical protein
MLTSDDLDDILEALADPVSAVEKHPQCGCCECSTSREATKTSAKALLADKYIPRLVEEIRVYQKRKRKIVDTSTGLGL